MIEKNKFAERLKELRNEKGLTQKQLSKETGIAQSTLSMYEVGTNSPRLDLIIILCRYFNVTSDYLIGLVD